MIFGGCQKLKLVLFADNTNIFCSGENLEELLVKVTKEINKLKIWFDRNKLSLNLIKTKIMLYGNCRISEQIQIQVDGVQIERGHERKFLGIIIDDKISWKPHINYIQTKLSRSISVLNKAKTGSGSQFTSHSMLFQSIVLSYFNYCVEIWGYN